MRRALLALALIIVVSVGAVAQEKHPYTFDDHISMKRISGNTLSPDGKWIAFNLSAYNKEENSGKTGIYLVSSDGGEAGFFVEGSSPVWSPDSKTIAFTKDDQIWLIGLEGGEPSQLTDIATGAGGPEWSPDGSMILFTSMVWPHLSAEENAEKLKETEESQIKAFATESLMFRHWNTWRSDGRKSHLFVVDVATGNFRDLMPDVEYDVPPFPFGGRDDYEFSPDSKEVAFIAKAAPNPAWHTNLDLFVISLAGGSPQLLTADNKAQDSGPVHYSPNGRYIAYGAMERPRFEADRVQLCLYDRDTGNRRSLTPDFDRSAEGWIWSHDGGTLYFLAQDKGYKPVFKVGVDGGGIEKVISNHTMNGLDIGPDDGILYFSRQSFSSPVELYKAGVDGSGDTKLTDVNGAMLAGIEMGRVVEEWFEGAEGAKVQVFIILPPGFDPEKKWPLVLLIHGGPQGAFSDTFHYRWNAQLFAAPGYVAAAINFHGSTGYGQAFTDSITKNWGGLPYEDIMKGLDYLLQRNYLDPERVAAAGGSYGGYMVNWIATQTGRFKALISHAGVYNLESMYGATEELWFPEWEFDGPFWQNDEYYRKWSPHEFAANMGKFKTPVLVIHGQGDFRVPVTQGFELYTALQRQGVPSRLLYYPDETHFVTRPKNAELWYKEVHGWFDRWIGTGPLPDDIEP